MLDESRDVTVRTGAYVTADETTRIKATKAVTLQRFFEARDRRARDAARAARDAAARDAAAALEAEREAERDARLFAIERRLRPRTESDFKLLRREFETWRLAEMAKIDAAFPAPVEGRRRPRASPSPRTSAEKRWARASTPRRRSP